MKKDQPTRRRLQLAFTGRAGASNGRAERHAFIDTEALRRRRRKAKAGRKANVARIRRSRR
ncbi:MAG TPA: hypothetical protein VFN04_06965 [Protaetiibacter sp.]|nr:hypothetical protein [Protaetiibacter sp.]